MNDKIFSHSYSAVRRALGERLTEDKPGYIQMLTGPRQVGKTTLLHEMEKDTRWQTIYANADTPAATLPNWWEHLLDQTRLASANGKVALLLDEVQYLPDWGLRVKAAFDDFKRRNVPVRIVLSGSSSLTLGKGAKETMAGRFERLFLSHWPAVELVHQFDLAPEEAVRTYVAQGSFPGGIPFRKDLRRWTDYVRHSIVEPAVGRDLLALELVRKPALLRQLLAIAAGHPAEIVALHKLRGELADAGALETIAHYLHLLEQSYLVAALPKYSTRELRRRAAPPKLILLSPAIARAIVAQDMEEPVPQGERWGRMVENACIAFAWNGGQEVCYWREEPWEVDFIMTGSWGSWAVEVKTGAFGQNDLRGLLEFCSRHREFRPLLLCDRQQVRRAGQWPVQALSWEDYLLTGPPA
jgi:uncharacterized protein